MASSPLKMSYSSGKAPKGLPVGGPAKIMKGERAAGVMYKSPSGGSNSSGRKATDKSSGQSNPVKGSAYDRTKYTQAKQPIAYSNAELGAGKCKFVC